MLLIIFQIFMVVQRVQSQRHVVNTTCVDLAKPSNQHFCLTRRQYDYNSLLDDTSARGLRFARSGSGFLEVRVDS